MKIEISIKIDDKIIRLGKKVFTKKNFIFIISAFLFTAGFFISSQSVGIPHKFEGHTLIKAEEINDNFSFIYNKFNDISPIGSIVAFHANITNPALPIPDGWMSCDGSVVNDQDSPLHGITLPDLNQEVYDGNRGFYLRGGSESGEWNESTYWTDNGYAYGNIGRGQYYGASFARMGDLDNESGILATYDSGSTLGDSRRFQVAAMTVVWIVRVK